MAKAKVSAGDLFHRVAFDKRQSAADGYGNTVDDWQEQFSCKAAFRHRGGSETVMAARLEGRHIMGVYLRSSTSTRQITTDWRMRDVRTGVIYALDMVDSVTDRAWVYLQVESGSAA